MRRGRGERVGRFMRELRPCGRGGDGRRGAHAQGGRWPSGEEVGALPSAEGRHTMELAWWAARRRADAKGAKVGRGGWD